VLHFHYGFRGSAIWENNGIRRDRSRLSTRWYYNMIIINNNPLPAGVINLWRVSRFRSADIPANQIAMTAVAPDEDLNNMHLRTVRRRLQHCRTYFGRWHAMRRAAAPLRHVANRRPHHGDADESVAHAAGVIVSM
jgi:hypothetical protein